jgi:hypothetical protein
MQHIRRSEMSPREALSDKSLTTQKKSLSYSSDMLDKLMLSSEKTE